MNLENTENVSVLNEKITPMMQQYLAVKQEYADCLLFYRMGDFYELFFKDAEIAANILQIALTKRGQIQNDDIPMCGVPYHSADFYLAKLIEAGFKVAIAEQMETPEEARKRGGHKAVVRREVVRIMTPGTVMEENLLTDQQNQYLASLVVRKNNLSLAWVDISTGEFYVNITHLESLYSDLSKISPKELLIDDRLMESEQVKRIINNLNFSITSYPSSFFELNKANNRLTSYFNISKISVIGDFKEEEICACGSLLEYVSLTQKSNLPYLLTPKKIVSNQYMSIDASTRKNLELVKDLNFSKKNSLYNILKKTNSSGGSRLLENFLRAPLIDESVINERLDAVEFLYVNSKISESISELLKQMPDLERSLNRIYSNRNCPQDLERLKICLYVIEDLNKLFYSIDVNKLPKKLKILSAQINDYHELKKELTYALMPEAPVNLKEIGVINPNYHEKLRELNEIRQNGSKLIDELKERYKNETGIFNLKITSNNVIGYFIEVTKQHVGKLSDSKYIHRQSLISSSRFTTDELIELEAKITHSYDKQIKLEFEIYQHLVGLVKENAEKLIYSAHAISELDVYNAFAKLSLENKYVRPIIKNDNNLFIKDGRHPVIEKSINTGSDLGFISNDSIINENEKIILLTGPNMAGKSTYLRQNALIVIMAQIGCFVPCSYAEIGIVDKIFSRIGAGDNLAKGESTFMVEMVETAIILNQATEKSLIILDEIGRGTSTNDGMAIAWSVIEYLHNKIAARTLFATHYHELINLTRTLSKLSCYCLKIEEWQNNVIFLYKVIKGYYEKSYGINVAKMAGIPRDVVSRANAILKKLEATNQQQNSLSFSLNGKNTYDAKNDSDNIISYINNIEIEKISPSEALLELANLKKLAGKL